MSDTLARVRRQCLAAGIDHDDPLAVLLVGLAEDREEFKRSAEAAARIVAAGAPGITAETQTQLLRAIPREVASTVRPAIVAAIAQLRFGALAAASALTLAVATGIFFLGRYTAPDSTPLVRMLEGAGFVSQIASLNDDTILREFCLTHIVSHDTDGSVTCTLPSVRITAALAPRNGKSR